MPEMNLKAWCWIPRDRGPPETHEGAIDDDCDPEKLRGKLALSRTVSACVFDGLASARDASSRVMQGSNGNVWGVCSFLFCSILFPLSRVDVRKQVAICHVIG